MTEILFYHLQRSTLEQVLPRLLEKTCERGQRAVVMTGSDERAEVLTTHLWTYKDRGFLPHGNRRDGHAPRQPIWLTAEDENPNEAEVLFLTDGATSDRVAGFKRCIELIDGNDAEAVAVARRRLDAYKESGHSLTCYRQTDGGKWQEMSDS